MEMTNNEQTIFVAIFFISIFCGLVLFWQIKKLNFNGGSDDGWPYPPTKEQEKYNSLSGLLAWCGVGISVGGCGILDLLWKLFKNS